MTTSVEDVFNQTAATYDADRARLIPGFDAFYATAVSLIPADAERILDLGAGTGLLSAFVRQRFPDAYLRLIDQSAPMLAQAKTRMGRDRNYAAQTDNYTTCDWDRSYDAIVSALSIHHLDDAAKQALFARIHSHLKPGGVFVNAEQILQPSPALEAAARQAWLAEVRALGATEPQIAASLFRQTEDRCAPIADQLDWLRTAGFTAVRCTYERGRFAVLAATRAV